MVSDPLPGRPFRRWSPARWRISPDGRRRAWLGRPTRVLQVLRIPCSTTWGNHAGQRCPRGSLPLQEHPKPCSRVSHRGFSFRPPRCRTRFVGRLSRLFAFVTPFPLLMGESSCRKSSPISRLSSLHPSLQRDALCDTRRALPGRSHERREQKSGRAIPDSRCSASRSMSPCRHMNRCFRCSGLAPA